MIPKRDPISPIFTSSRRRRSGTSTLSFPVAAWSEFHIETDLTYVELAANPSLNIDIELWISARAQAPARYVTTMKIRGGARARATGMPVSLSVELPDSVSNSAMAELRINATTPFTFEITVRPSK